MVAYELKALVRDMLCNGGDEVTGSEHLEVALNLRIETGAVEDRAVGVGAVRGRHLHLLDAERVSDDVLRQPLEVFALVG